MQAAGNAFLRGQLFEGGREEKVEGDRMVLTVVRAPDGTLPTTSRD